MAPWAERSPHPRELTSQSRWICKYGPTGETVCLQVCSTLRLLCCTGPVTEAPFHAVSLYRVSEFLLVQAVSSSPTPPPCITNLRFPENQSSLGIFQSALQHWYTVQTTRSRHQKASSKSECLDTTEKLKMLGGFQKWNLQDHIPRFTSITLHCVRQALMVNRTF